MSRRECMNVKVDAELVRRAKVVAAARRITLSDYVSDLLRPRVEDDLARVAAGLMRPADEAAVSPGETPSAAT